MNKFAVREGNLYHKIISRYREPPDTLCFVILGPSENELLEFLFNVLHSDRLTWQLTI